MSAQHTPGRLYIRTNRHPNTDGTPWGWVDLYEPGSMRQASPDGIQVTWSRGQTSEANARRLVACWNACEMVSTEDLEALTRPADVSWAVTIDRLVRERDELLAERDALQARAATEFVEHQRELSKALDQRDELLAALRPLITKRMGAEQVREGIQRAIAKVEGGAA